tara:strand:- start:5917 stop:7605 length:1689 start_codon:yes stop_codon:yes gene_type:complete
MVKSLGIALIFILVSCSGTGTKERHQLRELVRVGSYEEAIDFLDSIYSLEDEKTKLLYLMERGLIEFRRGQFYNATFFLQKAVEVHGHLSYVSIKDGINKTLVNETKSKYVGEVFEGGMLHFFKAYSYFQIYLNKKINAFDGDRYLPARDQKKITSTELKSYLQKARSEIVAWNSYLEKVKYNRLGKSVFKQDMLQHIFGGFIHEQMKTSFDRQTALLLYKKALDILHKNYNSYALYNLRYKKFIKDFSKLPSFSKSAIDKNYVVKTKEHKSLENFLLIKILSLSKASGNRTFKNALARYRPSQKVINSALKTVRSNVLFIDMDGIIGKKYSKTEYYSLERALGGNSSSKSKRAVARFGTTAIMLFATHKLGLMPPPTRYSPVGAEMGIRLGLAAGRGAAISFDVPQMQKIPQPEQPISLEIKGKKSLSIPFPVVAPVTEIAEQAVRESAMNRAVRQGARLAWKHLTAIATCMATYEAMKRKNSKFVAKQAAVFQYLALIGLIKETEKADTRYWSTLPNLIRVGHLELPAGKYEVTKKSKNDRYQTKSFSITSKNQTQIVLF